MSALKYVFGFSKTSGRSSGRPVGSVPIFGNSGDNVSGALSVILGSTAGRVATVGLGTHR